MLVLYDSKEEKYLALDGKKPRLVVEKEQAWRFEDKDINEAWHMAYKAAWLGVAQCYVYKE